MQYFLTRPQLAIAKKQLFLLLGKSKPRAKKVLKAIQEKTLNGRHANSCLIGTAVGTQTPYATSPFLTQRKKLGKLENMQSSFGLCLLEKYISELRPKGDYLYFKNMDNKYRTLKRWINEWSKETGISLN